MFRRLADLVRPIPDAELPSLRGPQLVAVRVLSAAMLMLVPAYAAVDILVRDVPVGERLVASGALTGAFVGIFLLSLRPHARRRVDRLLFALACAILVGIQVSEWGSGRSTELVLMSGAVPIILAAFVPWKPSLSVALAVTSLVVPLAGQALREVPAPYPPEMLAFYSAAFGGLAASANQVQRRLWRQLEVTRARANLLSADRMASLGRLTAGIAHELKTPLAAMANSSESARALVDELSESIGHPQVEEHDLREIAEELSHCLGDVEEGAVRAARYVAAIRGQTVNMNELADVEFSVAERVESVRTLLGYRFKHSSTELDTSAVDESVILRGDPTKLEQILANLVMNALDAADAHDQPVRVCLEVASRMGTVQIAVEDDGPGVPASIRGSLFDPLVSTRPEDGTGLGLSIARDIAEGAFGGTLELAPSRRGARFELRCPEGAAREVTRAAWVPRMAAPAARESLPAPAE